ncbi:ALA-interacting subunit 5-like [Andrographis paniculata]|uniref:ALA-interacting subunit 5-like n=1 Tax=Andrographis paniculata TaxID=175694 RepID=UPI0021E75461|nr:ALA-interacting subunit 5-like [Andrographis paniculata]XP_051138286.1 ALA-interacting subunit 5-like [Andrographis paniculata]
MGGGDGASSKTSDKPKYSRFTQQELPACKPVLTPGLVMATFLVFGITFIPIGLVHLSASDNVVQLVDRYDQECVPANYSFPGSADNRMLGFIQDAKVDKTCFRKLTVPKKMAPPIFVYYQLDNFYQNHRRYVKSRSDEQYRDPDDETDTGSCSPEGVDDSLHPIVPCGLIAWSLFNDTYSFKRNNVEVPVNKKGISWQSDRDRKFGSNVFPKNFQNRNPIGGGKLDEKLPLNQQEDLMVWMRPAAMPTFRKLYGRIETNLEASDVLDVVIQNNYNTYAFNGQKKLVISTTTWIGGKNDFLGKIYITVGGFCLFIAVIFIILYLIKPRRLGDTSYLSWNRNSEPVSS